MLGGCPLIHMIPTLPHMSPRWMSSKYLHTSGSFGFYHAYTTNVTFISRFNWVHHFDFWVSPTRNGGVHLSLIVLIYILLIFTSYSSIYFVCTWFYVRDKLGRKLLNSSCISLSQEFHIMDNLSIRGLIDFPYHSIPKLIYSSYWGLPAYKTLEQVDQWERFGT